MVQKITWALIWCFRWLNCYRVQSVTDCSVNCRLRKHGGKIMSYFAVCFLCARESMAMCAEILSAEQNKTDCCTRNLLWSLSVRLDCMLCSGLSRWLPFSYHSAIHQVYFTAYVLLRECVWEGVCVLGQYLSLICATLTNLVNTFFRYRVILLYLPCVTDVRL